jgi:hypothetical protein
VTHAGLAPFHPVADIAVAAGVGVVCGEHAARRRVARVVGAGI